MSSSTVEVTEGRLKGKECCTTNGFQYFAFKGIPYASPPVGELRFAIPLLPKPWDGVRDATINCNICAQYDHKTNTVIGHEDCLYLNVYTPKLLTETMTLLPVMVYFHGGGFISGNGTDDIAHGPDFLVEKDVIVVGVNYRLGILGFLSLDRKEAPGNMGLRDQVQALKWIQQNIKSFNGDPNNVTIFGVSAGGAAVEYLVLSPMAKGSFHKAIAQSGSSLNPWTHRNTIKDLAFKVSSLNENKITGEEELYKYLLNLPARNLITSSMIVLTSEKHKGGLYFGFVPTTEIEGDWEPFLSKQPYELLSQGQFTKVPLMMGHCSREGLLMLADTPNTVQQLVEEREMVKLLPFDIDDADKPIFETKLKSIYLESSTNKEPDDFALDFLGDVDFSGGIYVAAALIAKHHTPVYFYNFSYDGGLNYLKKKLNIKRNGACHGDDGGYLMKSHILSENVSDTDKLVRARIIDMWTNFAKTSNPTPSIDDVITTKWESISDTGFNYLEIGETLVMKNNFKSPNVQLFKELYYRYCSTN